MSIIVRNLDQSLQKLALPFGRSAPDIFQHLVRFKETVLVEESDSFTIVLTLHRRIPRHRSANRALGPEVVPHYASQFRVLRGKTTRGAICAFLQAGIVNCKRTGA